MPSKEFGNDISEPEELECSRRPEAVGLWTGVRWCNGGKVAVMRFRRSHLGESRMTKLDNAEPSNRSSIVGSLKLKACKKSHAHKRDLVVNNLLTIQVACLLFNIKL